MTKCPVCCSTRNCRWATSSDFEYLTSDEEYLYLVCECGVIYLDSPPVSQLTKIYPGSYYSFQAKRRGLIFRIKRILDTKRLRKMLSRLSRTTLSILDIGGGNGEMCEAALGADSRVTSTTIVDLDSSLENYHRTTVHNYICSKIEDFRPDSTFDVAMMINLLEHVENPRKLLNDTRKLLSPGGLLILQTPNINSLDARLFRTSHWGGLHAPRHWVLFDKNSLERILAEAGFIDVRTRYSQGSPFWAVSVLYWLQKVGLLTPGSQLMHQRRLYKPLLLIFSVFDVIRAQFGFRTSQMYVTARTSPEAIDGSKSS